MIFSYTPIYVADSAEGSKFQFEFSDAIPIESDWETAVEKKTAKFEKKKIALLITFLFCVYETGIKELFYFLFWFVWETKQRNILHGQTSENFFPKIQKRSKLNYPK